MYFCDYHIWVMPLMRVQRFILFFLLWLHVLPTRWLCVTARSRPTMYTTCACCFVHTHIRSCYCLQDKIKWKKSIFHWRNRMLRHCIIIICFSRSLCLGLFYSMLKTKYESHRFKQNRSHIKYNVLIMIETSNPFIRIESNHQNLGDQFIFILFYMPVKFIARVTHNIFRCIIY